MPYGRPDLYGQMQRPQWMQQRPQAPPGWGMQGMSPMGAAGMPRSEGMGQAGPVGWSGKPFNPAPSSWNPTEADWRRRLWDNRYLKQFDEAGYFDPGGNRMLQEAARMNAGNISGALQRQASVAAQSRGLDPTQRASAELNALLGGQGAASHALNQAMMQEWLRQAQFAQQMSLMQQQQMGQFGQYNRQPQGASPWAGILSAVGGGIGNLIAPGLGGAGVGSILGSMAGGGGGGAPRMGQEGFIYPFMGGGG